MTALPMTPAVIAICIGCGCNDTRACEVDDEGNGCHWTRVDYREGVGVCSGCPEYEARWDAGDRSFDADLSIEREDGTEFDREPESLLLPGDPEYSQVLSYLRDRSPPR